MKTRPQKMTAEQTAKIGAEYRALLATAYQQCEEHKAWLRSNPDLPAWLATAVDAITVELVQMEAGIKEDDRPTVTLVYSYPNSLHDWLSQPNQLSLSLAGGITLDGDTPSLKA